MKIMVEVKMRGEYIFDLLLFHMYSRFSGFLMNLLALSVMILGGWRFSRGEAGLYQALAYFFLGIAIIGFTPLSLKRRANRLMRQEKYQNPIQYSFDQDGIEEIIRGKSSHYGWKDIYKAIATPKDIAFYSSEHEVMVIPKVSFGEDFMLIMKLVFEHVSREKIYIR